MPLLEASILAISKLRDKDVFDVNSVQKLFHKRAAFEDSLAENDCTDGEMEPNFHSRMHFELLSGDLL
ncbi:hypothetical protein SDJN02_15159, partial [Cucurbita argyrosperma subsp. argyrosperma]